MENNNNDEYFKTIIRLIEEHRNNAYRKVNEELIQMYFEIGKFLSMKVKTEKWGSKIWLMKL